MKRLRPHGHCEYIEQVLPRTAKDRTRYAEALKEWNYRRHYGYLKAIPPALFKILKIITPLQNLEEGALANPLLVKPKPWDPKTEYEELFTNPKLNFMHALIQYTNIKKHKIPFREEWRPLPFRDVWPRLQHLGWKKRLYGDVMVYCAPSGEEFFSQRIVVDLAYLFDCV